MKYVIVAAFNSLFGCFMPPQAINEMTDDDLVESNRRAVLSGKIPPKEAEKLSLVKIGTFDDATGELTPIKPINLCHLGSFIPRETKKEVTEDKDNGEQQINA